MLGAALLLSDSQRSHGSDRRSAEKGRIFLYRQIVHHPLFNPVLLVVGFPAELEQSEVGPTAGQKCPRPAFSSALGVCRRKSIPLTLFCRALRVRCDNAAMGVEPRKPQVMKRFPRIRMIASNISTRIIEPTAPPL